MAAGRKTGGRTKGTLNKVSAERVAEIAASGMTPLQYLTSIYQDVSADEAKRIDCAKAAAPYVHAKLTAVDLSATDGTLGEAGAYAWQAAQHSPR